jgi:hydroxymethylglutaryl-CoA reductase (NADPH)
MSEVKPILKAQDIKENKEKLPFNATLDLSLTVEKVTGPVQDLNPRIEFLNSGNQNKKKSNRIPKFGEHDYDEKNVEKRRKWVEEKTGTQLNHIGGAPVPTEKWKGNIENLIGTVQVPIGIAGPIKINGEHAKGEFLVPMATTEGAIVTVYNMGMRIVTDSGGVNTKVKSNNLHISPVFNTETIAESNRLENWVVENFDQIKLECEATTRYGKLISITPRIMERGLILQFSFSTGDAQGMNLINVATLAGCRYIARETGISFFERSNYSAVKKISTHSIFSTFGKSIFSEITIKKETLRLLDVKPQEMADLWHRGYLASMRSNMLGINCQVANGIAAIFLACGQDIADISSSHVATSNCEVNKNGDLYVSLYIPSLLIGTVGGGTGSGSQKECLEIMGCNGTGKVNKLAEIIAATALAGEITTGAALVKGRFIQGHAALGRNKP